MGVKSSQRPFVRIVSVSHVTLYEYPNITSTVQLVPATVSRFWWVARSRNSARSECGVALSQSRTFVLLRRVLRAHVGCGTGLQHNSCSCSQPPARWGEMLSVEGSSRLQFCCGLLNLRTPRLWQCLCCPFVGMSTATEHLLLETYK